MDWLKAKNIILVMLILLNIFLLINVMSVKDVFKFTGQYQKDAKQALEEAGIVIEGKIPFYGRPLGRISYIEAEPDKYKKAVERLTGLTYEPTEDRRRGEWLNNGLSFILDGEKFIYTNENDTQVFSVEKEQKLCRELSAWIKKKGIFNDSFMPDRIIRDNDTVTVEFVRKYRGFPLFDNNIVFHLSGSQLIKVEGSLKVFDTIKLSKADGIVSANIALLTGKDKIKDVITSVEIGYLQPQSEELFDIPVWRICLKSGEKVYFNAYTGEWLEVN
jgi:regulatory protein YycI of two-component signal transduction system YycFG